MNNEPIFSALTGKDECSSYSIGAGCYREWEYRGYSSIQQCVDNETGTFGPSAIAYCCDQANTLCDKE
jgi:hypothetical protein